MLRHGNSRGNALVSSREKSSRGSGSPRRPTRSELRKFIYKCRRPPAELARENFPAAGHALRFACAPSGPCPARVLQASPTQTPARLANSPGFKSFHCPRWRIKFSLERFSDSVAHLFACPAVEKFCRASSAGGRLHL